MLAHPLLDKVTAASSVAASVQPTEARTAVIGNGFNASNPLIPSPTSAMIGPNQEMVAKYAKRWAVPAYPLQSCEALQRLGRRCRLLHQPAAVLVQAYRQDPPLFLSSAVFTPVLQPDPGALVITSTLWCPGQASYGVIAVVEAFGAASCVQCGVAEQKTTVLSKLTQR